MKTTYSKRQHDIDMRNRHLRKIRYANLPRTVEEFACRITEHVAKDKEGSHKLYIWCEYGAWHAKALRKNDGKLVKVMHVVFVDMLALLCEQLGIINKTEETDK
jgi:hypothetical protein